MITTVEYQIKLAVKTQRGHPLPSLGTLQSLLNQKVGAEVYVLGCFYDHDKLYIRLISKEPFTDEKALHGKVLAALTSIRLQSGNWR